MGVNFTFILFVLTSLAGFLWVLDRYYFRKRRAPDDKEPPWVEWGAAFFPVLLVVFVLRSFFYEPFRIPSGSMVPTLLPGDFILVNKFEYGIRLPVLNHKIVDTGSPARGDVMVFRYPENPKQDYIKRVVGLPGDTVTYANKRLRINGGYVPTRQLPDYLHPGRLYYSQHFNEKLGEEAHHIVNDEEAPVMIYDPERLDPNVLPHGRHCVYMHEGVTCTVPSGHYFVMGDNRDNSRDSRFWGFVPEENIIGHAFYIWMHVESVLPPQGFDLGRIGAFN